MTPDEFVKRLNDTHNEMALEVATVLDRHGFNKEWRRKRSYLEVLHKYDELREKDFDHDNRGL